MKTFKTGANVGRSQVASHRGVEVRIYDLNQVATYGIDPGFYYNIPLEGLEEDEVHLKGPYLSHDAAQEAAKEFISDLTADEAGLDVSDEEVDFQGDLPIDPNLEPVGLDCSDEEIEESVLFPVAEAELV